MVAKKTLSTEDLFKLSFLVGGALSPDGNEVLYVVLSVEDEKDTNAIWWHSRENGETRLMTDQGHSPAWSPDGRSFAFVSGRNDKPQLFVMRVDAGEARQLTTIKQGVSGEPV